MSLPNVKPIHPRTVENPAKTQHSNRSLAQLDHAHVWHPFTPMRQWREREPLMIERGDGPYLFGPDGRRYIDGTSSLWCNVHGHNHPDLNAAIRDQLDKVAHTTLLGLASPPSVELAAKLVGLVNPELGGDDLPEDTQRSRRLDKVFYSDAGATAVEVAFKMAIGYWHHIGRPEKRRFIGMAGAYHGDTTGSMSVGYSPLFHQPFVAMVFDIDTFPNPDPLRFEFSQTNRRDLSRLPSHVWPSEESTRSQELLAGCGDHLAQLLSDRCNDTAAVVLEPVMQGAAGMIPQPPGFVSMVRELCSRYDVLLIADEVATGFGRTGTMFACEHDGVTPDLLCLAKGLTGGYLPLAATLATSRIAHAFEGSDDPDGGDDHFRHRTLYHGHTYTGNPLACAAALASLDLFERDRLLDHIHASARIIADRLDPLRDPAAFPHIVDVRQRGIMVGIELGPSRDASAQPFDFSRRTAARLCERMRERGLILRPLGDVVVLMPIPAMPHDVLHTMLDIVLDALKEWERDRQLSGD